MTIERDKEETFLGRWSRLKKDQEKEPKEPPEKTADAAAAKAGEEAEAEAPMPPLPPLESLTPQSDFTGFMHPKVEDALRRVALKKLFRDPHFSIPDLNEAYSGDWTGGEPITQEFLASLNQARMHLFTDEEKKERDAREAKELAAQEQAKPEAAAEQATVEPTTEQRAEKQEAKHDEPGRQDT